MFGLFLVTLIHLAALNNAVETGVITLDPPAIHKEKAKIEHVTIYNQ